jgi:hypothetical protein
MTTPLVPLLLQRGKRGGFEYYQQPAASFGGGGDSEDEETVTWNNGISTLVKENFPQITIDRTDYQLGETVVSVDGTIITSIEGHHQELVHADV